MQPRETKRFDMLGLDWQMDERQVERSTLVHTPVFMYVYYTVIGVIRSDVGSFAVSR